MLFRSGPIALGQQAEAKDYEAGMTEDELKGIETEQIVEKEIPYWENPDFDWENKNLWINNPLAVKYWMNSGNSIHKYNRLYRDHLKEIEENNADNIKTY